MQPIAIFIAYLADIIGLVNRCLAIIGKFQIRIQKTGRDIDVAAIKPAALNRGIALCRREF